MHVGFLVSSNGHTTKASSGSISTERECFCREMTRHGSSRKGRRSYLWMGRRMVCGLEKVLTEKTCEHRRGWRPICFIQLAARCGCSQSVCGVPRPECLSQEPGCLGRWCVEGCSTCRRPTVWAQSEGWQRVLNLWFSRLSSLHVTGPHSKGKEIGGETQVDGNYIKVIHVGRGRKTEFSSNTGGFLWRTKL